MPFLQAYGKELVSLAVPLIAWLLSYFFKARPKLQFSIPHSFTFMVQEPLRNAEGEVVRPTQAVKTRSLYIRNTGRETATKLEIVLNWKPLCINIWPVRHYTEHIEPDQRHTLIFDSLAPGEALGCELLAVNGDLPEVVTVRSDQCVAQNITMYPQPVVSRLYQVLAGLLVAVGLATSVYLILVLVQYLVLKTPLAR